MSAPRASAGDASATDSPCKNICLIDPDTEQCIGCGRTRGEIAEWDRLTSEERLAIMARLPDRLAGATRRKRRKGGRRGRVRRDEE